MTLAEGKPGPRPRAAMLTMPAPDMLLEELPPMDGMLLVPVAAPVDVPPPAPAPPPDVVPPPVPEAPPLLVPPPVLGWLVPVGSVSVGALPGRVVLTGAPLDELGAGVVAAAGVVVMPEPAAEPLPDEPLAL
jgi:hypothetical protein